MRSQSAESGSSAHSSNSAINCVRRSLVIGVQSGAVVPIARKLPTRSGVARGPSGSTRRVSVEKSMSVMARLLNHVGLWDLSHLLLVRSNEISQDGMQRLGVLPAEHNADLPVT